MQLGFLEFEVRDGSEWERFMTGVLGIPGAGGGRFSHDGHALRFQIREGSADDLAAVGWEVEDAQAAASLLSRAGFQIEEADPAPRTARRRFTVVDPAGVPTELVEGMALRAPIPSPLVRSGFVADDLGLGHLVLTAPDKAASRAFYDALGFQHSDDIVCEIYGHPVDLSFFHVNPRHHSLAFGGPQRKRLHHFMVEARALDDVGLAYDRAIRAGLTIMQTLGRHPNDRMFSFYAKTPSGFQFEFGWGGRQLDAPGCEPQTYDHISEWGHHPPQVVFAPRKP